MEHGPLTGAIFLCAGATAASRILVLIGAKGAIFVAVQLVQRGRERRVPRKHPLPALAHVLR
jgi:hypothetical protein